jgi:hypothetical protein
LKLWGFTKKFLAAASVAAATAIAARDYVELDHGYSFLSDKDEWTMNRSLSMR